MEEQTGSILGREYVKASGPNTSWQIDGETVYNSDRHYFGGAPKSLQMVTAAMKLKEACSLKKL